MSDKLPPRILVIEFDELLSSSICNTIERAWFDVIRINSEEQAIRAAVANNPNIVIISSKLKKISAQDLAIRIRKIPRLINVPIIFLIEENESVISYNSVNNGFIEIIHKPFTSTQIIAAIKSLLRKSQPIFTEKIIKYKDLSMDLATYKVYRRGQSIHLGPTEFKILQLLMQSPQTIYSREQIIDHVWGDKKGIEPRTVDVHVNRLRTLIKQNTTDLPLIKTVRASGYCLNLPGELDYC